MKNIHILFLLSLVTLGNIYALKPSPEQQQECLEWFKGLSNDQGDDAAMLAGLIGSRFMKLEAEIKPGTPEDQKIMILISQLEESIKANELALRIGANCKSQGCPDYIKVLLKILFGIRTTAPAQK
jgi:hypothetical protein